MGPRPLRGANIGCADPLRGANIGCADVTLDGILLQGDVVASGHPPAVVCQERCQVWPGE